MKSPDNKTAKNAKPTSSKTSAEFTPPPNFIKHIVDADIEAGKTTGGFIRAFRRNPTGICTSATPNPSV
jgi:hypothetical protein